MTPSPIRSSRWPAWAACLAFAALGLASPRVVHAQSDAQPDAPSDAGAEPDAGALVGDEAVVDDASSEAAPDATSAEEAPDRDEPEPRVELGAFVPPPSPFDPPSASSEPAEIEAGARAAADVEEGDPPNIPRREVPSYDGREPTGPTADEVLAWIPRVIFAPLYVFFEYVLRQPVGWFMTTLERERWQVVLLDFFTWDDRSAGLVPTALWDFGLMPSAGFYFFWNDAGFEGNHLRAQVGFGGVDWLHLTVSDRIETTDETDMSFAVDAWRRPDQVFHGVGYDSTQRHRSRYFLNQVEGRYDLRFRPWRASEIRFRTGVTWNDFGADGYALESGDPSLGEAVAQGWYDRPAGFDGYTSLWQSLQVAIDSREQRPNPGHGVRVEGFVDQGFDLNAPIERRWLRYGGAVGGFVDVGDNRVLSLWGIARFADPLGSEPVPFLELARLGGEPLLFSGFLGGQLLGRSATALTLEYRYPVWVWLDGSVHASIGNVFDEQLSNFHVRRLRASFGFGLRSIGDRDQSFNVLVAFGSAPFDQGGSIDSIRVVIGSQQGF